VPVRADYNRIEADVAVNSRRVVLPYHWLEGLKANDGNEVVPVLRDDDPVALHLRPPRPRNSRDRTVLASSD
jgi:hypothetical protein